MRAKAQRLSFQILGLFYLLFSVILTTFALLSYYGSENSNAFVDLFSLLFYVSIISIPQTFYLYVISLFDSKKALRKWDKRIVHYYFPLLLLIVNIFSFFYLKLSSDEQGSVYEVSVSVMNYSNFIALLFIFPVLNFYYIYKTIKTYLQVKRQEVHKTNSEQKFVTLSWITQYIVGYCIFIILIYAMQVYSSVLAVNIVAGIFFTAYLIFIGVKGSFQKEIQFIRVKASKTIFKSEDDTIIDTEKVKEIKKLILEKIEEEPYLNKSLTIHQFSKSIDSNSKYVSKVLNSEFGQNFTTFINFYRIEKAKTLLASDTSSKYTIETISKLVGFQSKSAFNKAFKNFVSETPSEYKRKFD